MRRLVDVDAALIGIEAGISNRVSASPMSLSPRTAWSSSRRVDASCFGLTSDATTRAHSGPFVRANSCLPLARRSSARDFHRVPEGSWPGCRGRGRSRECPRLTFPQSGRSSGQSVHQGLLPNPPEGCRLGAFDATAIDAQDTSHDSLSLPGGRGLCRRCCARGCDRWFRG